jgi:hypothetical protein
MRPPKRRIPDIPVSAEVEEEQQQAPKIVMSKAARRRLKHATVVVTSEMREQQRQEIRELRKHLRMVKSNGGRRKLGKLDAKREREEEMATDLAEDARPRKKGRRLEGNEWIPYVQTLPDSMLPKSVASAEPSQKLPPMPLHRPQLTIPNPIKLSPALNEEDAAPSAASTARPRPSTKQSGPKKRSLAADEDLW